MSTQFAPIWNNASVDFSCIKANVTNTNSGSGSTLLDLQVDGVSRLQLDKNNKFRVGVTSSFAPFHFKTLSGSAFFAIQPGSGTTSGLYFGDSSGDFTHRILRQGSDQDYTVLGTMSFATGSPSTNRFSIDANGLSVFTGTVEQRKTFDTVHYAQAYRIYNKYTDTNNYERGVLDWQTTSDVLRIGTEAAGAGMVARNIALVGGNVGIGTTGPSAKLAVIKDYTWGASIPTTGQGQPGIGVAGRFNVINNNRTFYFDVVSSPTVYAEFSTYEYGTNVPFAMVFQGNGGNVGISNLSPAAKLDISDTTGAGSGSLQASALNIAQTWSTTGTPTAIKLNVTEVQSNAASLLMDLQVGGTSRFNVAKNGNCTASLQFTAGRINVSGGGVFQQASLGSGHIQAGQGTNGDVSLHMRAYYWTDGGSPGGDTLIIRDATGILAQRKANTAGPTTYPQAFRIYNNVDGTDAAPGSNYERAKIAWESNVLKIGTEGLGTGASNPRAMEFQTAGTTRLTIASTGAVAATGRITALDFLTTSDGRGFQVWQSAGGPAAIQFGMSVPGTGSGSDMWFSTTSNLNTWIGRLSISSSTGTATFYGDVQIADAKNIVINTTTGTKIGTATTQKLGFWNATPIVQPANTVAIDDVLVNTGLRASGGVNNFTNTLDLTIRTVTYGATMAIDAALGNKIAITLAGNGTISNPTNAVDGRVLVFRLRQDATGSRIPVWDTKYSFVGDLATVTLSTAANAIDRIAFEYDSTTDKWYCISFIKGS